MQITRRTALVSSVGALTIEAAQAADSGVRTWRAYGTGSMGQVHLRVAAPEKKTKKRPLICFHGSPYSGTEFDPFLPVMAKDRLVIAPDNPGFGGSDLPKSMPELPDYSRALIEAILDSELVSRREKFDVLGSHTGAVIATDLAVTQPNKVAKVVYTAIPAYTEEQRQQRVASFGKPSPLFTDPNYVINDVKRNLLGDSTLPEQRRLDYFISRMQAGTMSWWAPRAALSYPLRDALKKVTQPTLFLVVNDRLAPATREAATMVANAVLVDIEKQTGDPALDLQPELVAEEVRKFLDA